MVADDDLDRPLYYFMIFKDFKQGSVCWLPRPIASPTPPGGCIHLRWTCFVKINPFFDQIDPGIGLPKPWYSRYRVTTLCFRNIDLDLFSVSSLRMSIGIDSYLPFRYCMSLDFLRISLTERGRNSFLWKNPPLCKSWGDALLRVAGVDQYSCCVAVGFGLKSEVRRVSRSCERPSWR